jgi:hypothetical protein
MMPCAELHRVCARGSSPRSLQTGSLVCKWSRQAKDSGSEDSRTEGTSFETVGAVENFVVEYQEVKSRLLVTHHLMVECGSLALDLLPGLVNLGLDSSFGSIDDMILHDTWRAPITFSYVTERRLHSSTVSSWSDEAVSRPSLRTAQPAQW